MSDLDKAIRDRLAVVRTNMTAHYAVQGDGTVDAVWNDAGELGMTIQALLDWANALESDNVVQSDRLATTLLRQMRETIADSLGVSSQDTPPPPRRQWAVQHPQVITTAHDSEWSALYTLSKLPGGVLVTRDHPDEPWRPETECVCITVPDTGHYAGCPEVPVSTDTDGEDR